MKKKPVLSRKLILSKTTIAPLNATELKNVQGGESLECNTQRTDVCTTQQTTPGVAICVTVAAPTFVVTCPPPQVTLGCTIVSK